MRGNRDEVTVCAVDEAAFVLKEYTDVTVADVPIFLRVSGEQDIPCIGDDRFPAFVVFTGRLHKTCDPFSRRTVLSALTTNAASKLRVASKYRIEYSFLSEVYGSLLRPRRDSVPGLNSCSRRNNAKDKT